MSDEILYQHSKGRASTHSVCEHFGIDYDREMRSFLEKAYPETFQLQDLDSDETEMVRLKLLCDALGYNLDAAVEEVRAPFRAPVADIVAYALEDEDGRRVLVDTVAERIRTLFVLSKPETLEAGGLDSSREVARSAAEVVVRQAAGTHAIMRAQAQMKAIQAVFAPGVICSGMVQLGTGSCCSGLNPNPYANPFLPPGGNGMGITAPAPEPQPSSWSGDIRGMVIWKD